MDGRIYLTSHLYELKQPFGLPVAIKREDMT